MQGVLSDAVPLHRAAAKRGHNGKTPDQLPELVRLYGEVGALERLDEAAAVCRALAAAALKKGNHATAVGFIAAEQSLRRKLVELTERYS